MAQSKMIANAEKFLWANFKQYLMQFPTCLCDLFLEIKDPNAENPMDRYEDFLNNLEQHIGLGSYVTGQAAQFSRTPYMTVQFQAIPMGGCATRVVMGFDIAYATDTPKAPNGDMTRYVGSSAESVADFRADVMMALDELMFYAFPEPEDDEREFKQAAFFDRLRDQEITNPVNPNDKRLWKYGVIGLVDDESTLSEVTQLKREDRSTQLNLFHIVYKMDLNELRTPDWDCGC